MTTDTELRELLAKATPGPWRHYGMAGVAAPDVEIVYEGPVECEECDQRIALTGCLTYADAELIAAAVNALPGLLDRANERESEGWASYAAECERHAETTARADAAEAKLTALREGVERLIASPDDTQWWEVVPYMDPPDQDEVVEVALVAVDRLRALLDQTGGEQ